MNQKMYGGSKVGVQNAYVLEQWILEKELSENDEESIERVIGAFSEYLVAINPDYQYNKTYLTSFVEDFFECQKVLKRKREVLEKRILEELRKAGVDNNDFKVTIDNAWVNQRGKTSLLSSFSISEVKSNKMKFDIEFMGENGFSVANEVDLNKNFENTIKDEVALFLERYKEVCINV